jgi:hypothetical protein
VPPWPVGRRWALLALGRRRKFHRTAAPAASRAACPLWFVKTAPRYPAVARSSGLVLETDAARSKFPVRIQTCLQSKVKAANPTASYRVPSVEKMQTADIAPPTTLARPQDQKSDAPFINCVRNPLVAIAVRGACNVCLRSAPPMAQRLPRPCITTREWRTSCARPRAIKIWPNPRRNSYLD